MKKLVIFLILLQFVFAANAVVYQKIVLKNGSVLNGFIQRQDGDGNMTVRTDNAVICIKNTNLSISSGRLENVNNLTEVWKNWAKSNESYTSDMNGEHLLLTDVKLGKTKLDSTSTKKLTGFEVRLHQNEKSFTNVFILEKGSNVRFQEMTPNVYQISWDDIVSISAERRPQNALSGIDRKYTLKSNREIAGQYAGETENTISLYQPNGVVETVDYNDIVKFGYYGINPQQDIFAQSELLDVVMTKNEGDIRGVIIEQNYSSDKDAENYISIWVKDRSPQMVKISDINAICKEENTAYYQPKFDIILKDGQVVVNRNDAKYVGVEENNDILVLDSLCKDQIVKVGDAGKTKITVEMKQSDAGVVNAFQLVRVSKFTIKKNTFYGFSYKDLVNSNYRPINEEVSVNRTRRIEFVVPGIGVYALYDAKNKRAIPLIVK